MSTSERRDPRPLVIMSVLGMTALTIMLLSSSGPPPLHAMALATLGAVLCLIGGRTLSARWPKAAFSAGVLSAILFAPMRSSLFDVAVWVSTFLALGGALGVFLLRFFPSPCQRRNNT